MNNKKNFLTSLLFYIYPAFFYFSQNRGEVYILDFVKTTSLICLVFLPLYFISTYLIKSSIKTSLILVVFSIYIFSFGHIYKLLSKNIPDTVMPDYYTQIILIGLYTFLAGIGIVFVIKHKSKDYALILNFLMVIIGILFILSVIPLLQDYKSIDFSTSQQTFIQSSYNPKTITSSPDIYYIIPDRYANNSELKDYYRFDNKAFTDFLTDQGFFVSFNSFANYPKTHLSLASSLNMRYLDDLKTKYGEDNKDQKIAFSLAQDNEVKDFLISKGYEFIYMGGWWGPIQLNSYAHRNINMYGTGSDFIRGFSETTILTIFANTQFASIIPMISSGDQMKRENILFQINMLKKLSDEKINHPRFIIAHLFIPHYPYLFDENCKNKTDVEGVQEDAQYIKQLECTNTLLTSTVKSIMKNSNNKSIIILQSDEGPFLYKEMKRSGEGVDWTKVSPVATKMHTRILNAYYFPSIDNKNSQLYDGISPVNTFRVLFNYYFDSELTLHEDKSYFIKHLDYPYSFFDITKIVKFTNN